MADVVKLSSLSIRFSSSSASSLISLQPAMALAPARKFDKKICSLSNSSFESVSGLALRPRKQLESFKVHATITETDQPKWWEKNAGPNMVDIHSTQEFLSALNHAEDRLVIVEFYGTWCASCRALFPKICKTAQEHPEILFLKVNFDKNKPMCKNLNIKVLPCFHFYRGADGRVESFSCSLPKFQKVKDAIEKHNKACGSTDSPKGIGDLQLETSFTPKGKSEYLST